MYTAYYKLSRKPFEVRPDVSFYWFGDRQREILSEIQMGVQASKAFQLLTGDTGVGKSTLLHTLVAGLDKNVKCAVVEVPHPDALTFYNIIATGFGFNTEVTSKVQFLVEFSHFLKQAKERGVKILLVVDNAQRLDQEMLDEIRMLSNIEKDDSKLLNILLVGRSKFAALLSLPRNKVVRQRLSYKTDLKPLSYDETKDYIVHRLQVAACDKKLFTDETVELLHEYTGGFPGQINEICDRLLELGAERERESIDVEFAREYIRGKGEQDETVDVDEHFPSPSVAEEEHIGKENSENVSVQSPETDQLTDIKIGKEQNGSQESQEEEQSNRGQQRKFIWVAGIAGLFVLAFVLINQQQRRADESLVQNQQEVAVESSVAKELNKSSSAKSTTVGKSAETKARKIIIPGAVTKAQDMDSVKVSIQEKQLAPQSGAPVDHLAEKSSIKADEKSMTQNIPKKATSRIVLRKLVVL